MIETSTDRLVMLNDFGQDAIYTHNNESVTIKGILDLEFEEIDVGGSIPFAMQRPRFHCRTSDISAATNGDTLEIDGVTYIIRVLMPDGTGMTQIQLEQQ